MGRTNYVEAVGLITIGFAIYDTIFGQFAATDLATEWSLTSDFDTKRMALIIAQCVLIAVSLKLLQIYDHTILTVPAEKDTRSVIKWAFPGVFSKNNMKQYLPIIMQIFSTVISFELFGNKTGICLAIGFAFVDYAIFDEARARLRKEFVQ